ncbi:uncharacterized protein SCHCODRAFT_02744081 [Schizophyllum commune H4-8]|uniref:uncharacterized protein n=1 Tax=Schizophyllum commune (strain H4-8 / FGSC 9210) TaxID=578458 RepID=UPI00215EE4BC|nr:uncharacterized protein SCHCODRAFT_02744081 [Schizophyllum commune H4-8]KAI5897735.1 hypothetical protein SCHCODRAFT_02744081 [Schizophyllum commune H4-8]
MSTLVLYTIPPSVWASAARLAIYELGYEDDVKFKDVNLAQGENFHPEFLAKNPNGTLPTLETPEGTLTNTTDVIKYLVEHASKEVKTSDVTLIESLHSDALDPNFAKQMARTEEELAAKSHAFLLAFLEGRQRALEEQSARPEGAPYKDFYDAKKASNGDFLAIVNGSAPSDVKQVLFDKAKALHENLRSFIYDELPRILPNPCSGSDMLCETSSDMPWETNSGSDHFLGGDLPGEADFHLAAWLARIFSTCGADAAGDASEKSKAAFGGQLPPSVLEYWNAWVARPSWGKVYGQGLH